jgi:hypothetical protein
MPLRFDPAIFDQAIFDPGEIGAMADLSITWSDVKSTSTSSFSRSYFAGEAFDAGQIVVLRDNLLYKANASNSTFADALGMSLNKVAANQPVAVALPGANVTVTSGQTANGTFYYLSSNPGNICTTANLASGNYVTQIGYGVGGDTIMVDLVKTGLQKP